MKLIFLIVVVFPCLCFGQNTNDQDTHSFQNNSINGGLLIGNWLHVDQKGNKGKTILIEFQENQDFKLAQHKIIQTGTWKFDKQKMEITFQISTKEKEGDKDLIWKLSELSDNQFVVVGKKKLIFAKQPKN